MPFPIKKKKDPFGIAPLPKGENPLKPPKPMPPSTLKETTQPGNRDFGLIGESAPAPVMPTRVPRLAGELGLKKKKPKGF